MNRPLIQWGEVWFLWQYGGERCGSVVREPGSLVHKVRRARYGTWSNNRATIPEEVGKDHATPGIRPPPETE